MLQLLCRNRVKDYPKWRKIFDDNLPAGKKAGLHLTTLWQDINDPNNIFFIFQIEDIPRAKAFLENPKNTEIGQLSGVIDGKFYFVEDCTSR